MLDAQGWDERYASKEWVLPEDPMPQLVELASGLEPGRALDLAAGEGRNALWLARQGWRVTAVDFSRVGLEKAARRAGAEGLEVECVVADVRDYRPTRRGFELVLIAYMHPDPSERPAVLGSAAEAVAPGGHLLVVGYDLAHQPRGRGPSDPDRRFTPERLAGAFPRIELARCESVAFEVERDEGPEEVVITVACGRRPG